MEKKIVNSIGHKNEENELKTENYLMQRKVLTHFFQKFQFNVQFSPQNNKNGHFVPLETD